MILTTVIYSNGLVVSTYSDGKPADEYTGKLDKLLLIQDLLKKKYTIDKKERVDKVEYYYAGDPLCSSIITVDEKFIKSYIEHLKLLAVALNTTPDKIVNEESLNIDTAIKPNIEFKQDLPY